MAHGLSVDERTVNENKLDVIFAEIKQKYSGGNSEGYYSRIEALVGDNPECAINLDELYQIIDICKNDAVSVDFKTFIASNSDLFEVLKGLGYALAADPSNPVTQTFLTAYGQLTPNVHANIRYFLRAHLRKTLQNIQWEQKQLDQAMKAALQKIDAASATAGEVLTGNSLNKFSNMFQIIAKKESKTACVWFLLTACFGVCLFLNLFSELDFLFYSWKKPEEITRRIALSVGCALASLWTGKRYALCRQQAIVYRHLSCIMNTFNRFRASLSAQEQELVTLEAVRTLFPVPKLLDKHGNPGITLANAVDLIKTFSQGRFASDDKDGRNK